MSQINYINLDLTLKFIKLKANYTLKINLTIN
jgi:hypothetical protein